MKEMLFVEFAFLTSRMTWTMNSKYLYETIAFICS